MTMTELRPSVIPYALPDEVVVQVWTPKAERNLSHLDRYMRREKARADMGGILRIPHLDAISSRSQIGEKIVDRTITTHSEVSRAIYNKKVGGERFTLDPCDACTFAEELGCTALVGITAMDNQCAETRRPVRMIGTRGTIPMKFR